MSVNKVILIGNLGQDPELKHLPSGSEMCNLRIATTERRKGKDGNWTDQTEWHTVILFGKAAENAARYLQKGRQVYIEGRLQTRKWQDRDGKDRYSTEVVGNEVKFLGGGGSGGRQGGGQRRDTDQGDGYGDGYGEFGEDTPF